MMPDAMCLESGNHCPLYVFSVPRRQLLTALLLSRPPASSVSHVYPALRIKGDAKNGSSRLHDPQDALTNYNASLDTKKTKNLGQHVKLYSGLVYIFYCWHDIVFIDLIMKENGPNGPELL